MLRNEDRDSSDLSTSSGGAGEQRVGIGRKVIVSSCLVFFGFFEVRAEESKSASNNWAFQIPQISAVPEVEDADWPRSPIDVFTLSKLEEVGLKPVADSDRRTLVRRLYFDLIGLPPKPDQVRDFVDDPASDAVSKLVDELLASPRFGEKWGRHWLDVVRFAESSGKEFNFSYPHAWPYRDYVIEAFNSDKPYDRFIKEQLSGDLMTGSAKDREERLIATSLLSFGAKRHNSGGMAYRMEIVDDQIDVTTRAFLGLTVACAKCHDHKFDPIPTKDYYSMAGIFLSTEALYGTIKQKYSNNPTDLLPLGPKGEELHSVAESYEKKIDAAKKSRDEKKAELTKAEKEKKEGDEASEALVTKFKEELTPLEASVKELEKKRPPRPPYAMTVRDRSKPADTKIAIRGELSEPGELAPRGFLSAIPIGEVAAIDPKQSGRLQLADWMVSRKNPLPARVMVNRIWHHLFGRGLVESVDNFGATGSPPSHPELLDTLAVKFMDEGWSIKRTIRKIVLSRTYQLSCETQERGLEIDPENRLLWRSEPRRLPVEAIRDAILAVSGQLDVEPPVGSTVTGLGDKLVRGVDTETLQPPSNHRSVYLPVIRDYAPEMFDCFDFPSSSLVSGKRAVTEVPTQALFLRNSKFVAEQAHHAAKGLLENSSVNDDLGRINLVMQRVFSRAATSEEQGGALALLALARDAEAGSDESAWSSLFLSLFSTAEFRYLVDIE
ncbi:DUF1553 domain-containing protein [Akkermansiaceae bacterium]|nr:DUF1553 domain-containing protein [Akkermansiaceae bacterium]